MNNQDKLQMKKLQLGPFGTNCYTVTCTDSKETFIIDPADFDNSLMNEIEKNNTIKILLTHNHFDHIQGLKKTKDLTNAPVCAHSLDAANLGLKPDIELKDGDILKLGNFNMNVIFTPGHTPGSICFHINNWLFAGDTIFPGGPGKTANPKAFNEIIKSIEEKIFALPPETMLYPGHGDNITVKESKQEYSIFQKREKIPNLCGDVLWES